MTRCGDQRGQTAAEYLGILLVVAVVIGLLATSGIGARISCEITSAIGQGQDAACGDGTGGAEAQAGDPAAARDTDGDGLSDAEEARAGSDPTTADSDGDGASDGDERRAGTDPRSPDSDGDGVSDGDEAELGTDPREADTDGDGASDGEELDTDSDPFAPDSDGDGEADGEDSDPLTYDGNFGDAVAGAVCGESSALLCPDEDDPKRTTPQYLFAQILSGIFAVGDVRDGIGALIDGKVGDAFWAAVGVVPVAGDAAKIGKAVRKLVDRFPARRGQLIEQVLKVFPDGRLKRIALDEATDGAYSVLRDRGVSDAAIEQLARRGNDLRRLADSSRLTERSLDATEARRLEDAVANNGWPNTPQGRAEGYGVESALAELERNPNVEILYDGRPKPGRPSQGPDIVAIDRSTGRPIVVEAKGTQGTRPLSGRTVTGRAGGQPLPQTSPAWLRGEARRRYLDAMDRTDPRAAEVMRDIVDDDAPFDAKLINSRPAGRGGFGTRLDEAAGRIREDGQVADLEIIDVQRP